VASKRKTDERRRSLETLAVLAAACIACAMIFKAQAFAYVALGLLLVGLFFRWPAVKLAGAWLGFSAVLGAINSKILLTLVYYLVLTPIALLYRLTHRDPLSLKRAADSGRSHWIIRDHQFGPRDLERPW
jgi:Saxitoxin biosynthesis operon protein SxtJ